MWTFLLLLAADTTSRGFPLALAAAESLQVTVAGSGAPVVLLPGLFGSAYGYRKVAPALAAAGYRAIVSAPPASNIEVTAVGTGPVGLPAEGESETPVLRFDLPDVEVTISGWRIEFAELEGHARLLQRLELGTPLLRSMEEAQAASKRRAEELYGRHEDEAT